MTNKGLFLLLAVCLAALGLATVAASQDDMLTIKDPAFPTHRRAPAVFAHNAHNAKAGLDDCASCHHGGKNGVMDKKDTSEGTPCADCHSLSGGKGVTPLQRAWHRQCMGCHRSVGKGPLACGDCHKPS